jgi:hypothetical protein
VKKLLFSLFFCFSCLEFYAQQSNNWTRSELGVSLGTMYYIGDLNQFRPFYETNLAGGLMYRFNYHSRLTLRINYTYGSLDADDKDSKITINKNRNLNFHTDIHELVGGIEFHYLPFQLGHKRYPGTAYILAQFGAFYMNPKTNYNGQEITLKPLGTEGQIGRDRYSNIQICIPLGLGAKFSLGKSAAFSFDVAIRKTYTDYIDDVGASYSPNTNLIPSLNGTLAGSLSNQSLDGTRYGIRGNSRTSDWYVYAGAMLTFRLGKENVCWDWKK